MVFSKKIFLFSLLILLPTHGLANSDNVLEQQRTIFQKAKKALEKRSFTQFNRLKKQLGDYPLSNYLEYRYLRSRLNQTNSKEIEQFIQQNKNTFYGSKLRNVWLDRLAKKRQWKLYLEHYQLPQPSSRQCSRIKALIASNQHSLAQADIPSLWLVGKSQHKNCDFPFQYWQTKGKLTNNLRWQRLNLALQNQQFLFANYLARSVKDKTAAERFIHRWQKMQYSPLSQLKLLPLKEKRNTAPRSINLNMDDKNLVQYGLIRLSRKSATKAFQQWQRLASFYNFSPQQKHSIQASIANRAALNRQDNALTLFGDLKNEHWRVRAALWQQDWAAVQLAIKSLSLEQQNTNRWQYWRARSYAALGDQHKADEMYHKLMLERDYYSFLAADKLGKDYHMNHHPFTFKKARLDQFSKRNDIASLYEFYVLNMGLESRQQAYYLNQSLSKYELEMLATFTHQWGWHSQTIALLGKAQSWDALNLRFPVVFEQNMIQASSDNKLDASWLMGIARQESAFNPKARSPVGALGLMQLMPATAKSIAKRINQPLKGPYELVNPRRSIELGSAYLKHVYKINQNNPILAIASYNAGPHRVSRWLPKNKLPADIWIENIPFTETRRYTRNVITYAAIFDYQRQRTITPLSIRMPAINPKTP
jgi:soluble lytic murein transglycosylase